MSTPVMPRSIIIFKMVREFEKTNRKNYTKSELFRFAHDVLQIASVIDNEEYWILSYEKYGPDFVESISRICDVDLDKFTLNEEKFNNGGKQYAEKIIGMMPYSFLKASLQVLNNELQETDGVSL